MGSATSCQRAGLGGGSTIEEKSSGRVTPHG